MKVAPYLKILAEKDGPNSYLSTGAKFNGTLTPLGKDRTPSGLSASLANELMSNRQRIIKTIDA